jgi:hypothetical protein
MPGDLLSIDILGVRLDEPVTVVTDIIIASVCFYAFFRLKKTEGQPGLRNYLKFYFLLLGIGTLLGGVIGHGLLYLFSPVWKLPGWITCMAAIALLEQASILMLRDYLARWKIRALSWQNILLLIALLIPLMITINFIFAVAYITFGLLIVVGGIHLLVSIRSKTVGSMWILIAVATGLAGDFIFVFDWSLHDWFNNSDLSHVFLAFSAWFFYVGARYLLTEENRVDLASHAETKSSFKE